MAKQPLPKNDDAKVESPAPGVPSVDPRKQVPQYPARAVVGGGNLWSFSGLENQRVFPSPNRTGWAQGWVGRETRRAMLDHHKITQAINNLKNAVVGDGARWIPAVNPYRKGEREYFEEAVKYTQLMEFSSRQMRGSNWYQARQLLDCIFEGNKIAPITLREETKSRKYKGAWVLDTLNVWHNGTYEFWSDEYGNFNEIRTGTGVSNSRDRYPKEKFVVMSYRPISGNPYGSTVLSAVYKPFYKDVQMDVEEMAYAATWGRPSIVVFAAPPPEAFTEEEPQFLYTRDGVPLMEPDPDNLGMMRQRKGYQKEQNAIALAEFKAGSVWSMEYGAIVQVLEPRPGGSDLFENIRRENARNIMGVIYGTHQVTEAERNISTGNQEVGEGVAGLNVTEGKKMLEEAEENDIARQVLEFNHGPGALDLVPIRDYGSGQNGRLPKVLNAQVGFASNGAMDKAQYWDLCASNGLPLPWPDSKPLVVRVQGTGGGDKTGENDPPAGPAPTDAKGATE